MFLGVSCWNNHRRLWKRRRLKGGTCCSKMCSVLKVLSQMYRLPTNNPPTHTHHDRHWILYTGNNLDGPFLLWPGEHHVHNFHKRSERLTRQTTVHTSTEHRSISEPREVGGVSGRCWYVTPTVHSAVLTVAIPAIYVLFKIFPILVVSNSTC